MEAENRVYRDLQKRLDEMPVGFPATESGVEIRILKHLFSPEEAMLALYLSMLPEPLSRIRPRLKSTAESPAELEKALDGMVRKGAILLTKKDDVKHYSLMPLAVGMYETQVDRLTRDFAADMNTYLKGEFGEEFHRTKMPQLRTIPVQKSIPIDRNYKVGSYDDLRELIENVGGQIAVINCICRQNRNVIGEKCAKTDLIETCFVFREIAGNVVRAGVGRPLDKAEALAILAKIQDAGLVVQPENSRRPSFVCCCCGDCCGVLTTVKRFPRPVELFASNFYAEVDASRCWGCQVCVKRCQLDAISVVNGNTVIDLNRCIGCGNCVPACKFGAVRLMKKEREITPPEDSGAMYREIMAKKIGGLNMLKIGIRTVLRRKV